MTEVLEREFSNINRFSGDGYGERAIEVEWRGRTFTFYFFAS